VALAINPKSAIPWEEIIEDYKSQRILVPGDSFADYIFDFDIFLSCYSGELKLSEEDSHILFFGYGPDDIFPVAYDASVIVEGGILGLGDGCFHFVTQEEPAFFHMLGDFDSVSTLLFGATHKTKSFIHRSYESLFEEYAIRVYERFKGTRYEAFVRKRMETYDYKSEIKARLEKADGRVLSKLSDGVDSFSVEDLVTSVESVVNANIKLNHLRSGANGKPGETKEIAVITIPEGLSWIKHSIFRRRNEI